MGLGTFGAGSSDLALPFAFDEEARGGEVSEVSFDTEAFWETLEDDGAGTFFSAFGDGDLATGSAGEGENGGMHATHEHVKLYVDWKRD